MTPYSANPETPSVKEIPEDNIPEGITPRCQNCKFFNYDSHYPNTKLGFCSLHLQTKLDWSRCRNWNFRG